MFRGNLRLDAAPGVVITRDHNRAFHRNSHPVEPLVILGDAIVHVDQRRRHVSINRISVVGGKLFRLLVGSRINRKRRFLQFGGEFRGLQQFHGARFRSWE